MLFNVYKTSCTVMCTYRQHSIKRETEGMAVWNYAYVKQQPGRL